MTKAVLVLPGHLLSSHFFSSLGSPAQSFPLPLGDGLVHVLSLEIVPMPQLVEHDPSNCQVDQLPSLGSWYETY